MNPEFGVKLDGIEYVDRPGVYALIENDDKQIAAIRSGTGFFLPGGGIDPGETEIEALKRELMEEIGHQVSWVIEMGTAIDYIHASREDVYYRIMSKFYKVKLGSKTREGSEMDHQLVWLLPYDALRMLVRPSQVWAVQNLSNAK
jgi:8-oxo-dGTP diphosphatase